MRGYLKVVFALKTARFIQWFVKEMCPDVKILIYFRNSWKKVG